MGTCLTRLHCLKSVSELLVSKVYVTSDWHLGHANAIRWRDQFSSQAEHDATIIKNYMRTITKRDTVYFLGDIVLGKDREERLELLSMLASLPGHKHLVLGNHDLDRPFRNLAELEPVFGERIYALKKYKGFWLSHAPIHPRELRGKRNIHGHVHEGTIPDVRYYNACLENTAYSPKLIEEIGCT